MEQIVNKDVKFYFEIKNLKRYRLILKIYQKVRNFTFLEYTKNLYLR